jgi:hypothetical protein
MILLLYFVLNVSGLVCAKKQRMHVGQKSLHFRYLSLPWLRQARELPQTAV